MNRRAKSNAGRRMRPKIIVPKQCFFCEKKTEPWYTNIENLNRFITERGKIIGRVRSGICAKHQRHLSLAIKYARHLSLMPFVVNT